MTIRAIFKAVLLASAVVATASAAHAQSTSAHAMVVGGHAQGSGGPFACATSGPQAQEAHFFNTGIPLPTEGYAGCGLSGGIQNTTSATGPSMAQQAVIAAVNGGSTNLSANAKAGFDGLHVKSNATSTAGFTDAFTYAASEAAAYSTDTLNQAGSGAGFIYLGFSIDGSVTSVGNGQTQTFLDYQIGSGSIFTTFSAQTVDGTSTIISPTNAGGSLAGFSASGASLSGSGTVFSFMTPITLGTNFDLTLALYASSYPGIVNGVEDNDFFSTAKLTSISVFDAAGHPLDVAITSASGTRYDAFGAHVDASAAPEAATWAMLLLGFGGVGAVLRRGRALATA
jgi:hypothetical protein